MKTFWLGVLSGLTWWINFPASTILFGEYPYPEEDEN